MTIILRNAKYVPGPLKSILHPISNRVFNKYVAEMAYWQSRYEIDQGIFSNRSYWNSARKLVVILWHAHGMEI